MAIEYKLVPLNSKLIKGGGYRAVVDNDGYVKDMDDILAETSDRFGLKAPQLKMCMEAVLDTMIRKVAEDGIRRRFGDYFTLRLDIKGRFEGRDSKPDGSQRPHFNLQLLGAFKDAERKIRLANEVPRKRIYIEQAYSRHNPVRGKTLLYWGDAVTFQGKNLAPLTDGDYFSWRFIDAAGNEQYGQCQPYLEEHAKLSGRTDVVYIDWPATMPRSAIGRKVTFTYHSRAGDPSAAMQEHSIDAEVAEMPAS
jgi:hypothetical protein